MLFNDGSTYNEIKLQCDSFVYRLKCNFVQNQRNLCKLGSLLYR